MWIWYSWPFQFLLLLCQNRIDNGKYDLWKNKPGSMIYKDSYWLFLLYMFKNYFSIFSFYPLLFTLRFCQKLRLSAFSFKNKITEWVVALVLSTNVRCPCKCGILKSSVRSRRILHFHSDHEGIALPEESVHLYRDQYDASARGWTNPTRSSACHSDLDTRLSKVSTCLLFCFTQDILTQYIYACSERVSEWVSAYTRRT